MPKITAPGPMPSQLVVTDLKLVTAGAPHPLAQATREWIAEGWQPLGPAQFFPNGDWAITLVKYGVPTNE